MNRYLEKCHTPIKSSYELYYRLFPKRYWRRYKKLAQLNHCSQAQLLFSFDCDRDRDAEVVLGVDEKMRQMGVSPAYAVPGELLIKHKKTYRQLLKQGAEFINHGYTEHMYWDSTTQRHESCFFYNEVSANQWKDDVLYGHDCLGEFLGASPKGFRTPHFGTFQRRGQLSQLHQKLDELGYEYSTSTMPLYSVMYGPIFEKFGILEIPVSSAFSQPIQVLDSWGYFESPQGRHPQSYRDEVDKICSQIDSTELTGLFNYYADPSHIHDSAFFFEAVERLATVTTPITFSELLSLRGSEGPGEIA